MSTATKVLLIGAAWPWSAGPPSGPAAGLDGALAAPELRPNCDPGDVDSAPPAPAHRRRPRWLVGVAALAGAGVLLIWTRPEPAGGERRAAGRRGDGRGTVRIARSW
jgi:hypothetical protein